MTKTPEQRILKACKKDKEQTEREILKIAKLTSGAGSKRLRKMVEDGFVSRRKLTQKEQRESEHGLTKFVYLRTNKEVDR